MSRAQTEPTDGFLDNDFASFRKARLRARRAKDEEALEPRRKPAEPAPEAASGSIEAMLDGLDPEPDPAPQDATRAAERPEPAEELPKINKVPALSPLAFPEAPTDETRSHARADLPAESCSDPEFEKFRAARRPDSARHRKPEVAPADAAATEEPAPPRVDDSCSDPEFEKFRAARTTGRHVARTSPSSDKHPRPVAAERPPSGDKHPRPVAAERPPSGDKHPRPVAAERPPSGDKHPRPVAAERPPSSDKNPRPVAAQDDVDGSCSDPEFEKFRAARQARPDTARHRKPEPEVAEPAPVASAPTPEELAAGDATQQQGDDGALFFGTSVHERAKVRAKVLESRSDVDGAPEDDANRAAAAAPEPPTPAQGERRRSPPPPLPQRP